MLFVKTIIITGEPMYQELIFFFGACKLLMHTPHHKKYQ